MVKRGGFAWFGSEEIPVLRCISFGPAEVVREQDENKSKVDEGEATINSNNCRAAL